MSGNPFYRLAPFIQEYIYRHNWTELREVQVLAGEVLFNSDSHLILAAGTASGKTEAAFLPILTSLYEEPPHSIGVLYIGPTKALINDQFFRLEGLLEEAHIPVWAWHGDVPANRKRKLLQKPQGVLQITPESLESLLINRQTELGRLFSDVRFVVIDEVHIFMNSDRGRQILCQLERLAPFMAISPRRVGLSATLGDYHSAESWLQANTARSVTTVSVPKGGHVRLAMEHFYRVPPAPEYANEPDPYEQYIFARTQERSKTLIFANSRGGAENSIASLRQIAQRNQLPDIYHVHHGSISAPLRESAEQAMRTENQAAVTAATLTLELGIDIGQLERIIQLNAPFSVAGFLQRLGRSGRRGNPSEMWFVCDEEVPSGRETLPQLIPWSLLQCIAIMQLYLEEKWIEPIRPIRYPYSLLYHQTMSTLAGMGELSPAGLARRVLTLPPFQHITQADYQIFLRHLLAIEHLERMERGGLIIGLAGEKVVQNYRFYAVFQDTEEFTVRSEEGEIGRIVTPPPPGDRFALAGRTWEVIDLNPRQRLVFVKPVPGKANVAWMGSGGEIHTRILQRMRQALVEENEYRYLQPGALARLKEARQLARQVYLEHTQLVPLGGDLFVLFPWLGTIPFNTLTRVLQFKATERQALTLRDSRTPYYLLLHCPAGADALQRKVAASGRQNVSGLDLMGENEAPEISKYDEFVPDELKRKGFALDYLSQGT